MSFQTWAGLVLEPKDQPAVKTTRTPQCIRCGRFCRVLSDRLEYDGNGTQNYVTFDCKSCGTYTEGMW